MKLTVPKEPDTAILVVNGGRDPKEGRWLALCVGKILEHTEAGTYRLYVWNNNTDDAFVEEYLRFMPGTVLVQAPPGIELAHPHADPLQLLYERARSDGAKYVVTMDSDAHPIQGGWLGVLRRALDGGAVVAGVWRDELGRAITPYVHASCLATTVDFIESRGLRLDYIAPNRDGAIHDTLSVLTETARREGRDTFGLQRSNRRNFHRLMGGIYGDIVYHHGAGSRAAITFWDEERTEERARRNAAIGRAATHLVLTRYDAYLGWLRGEDVDEPFPAIMGDVERGVGPPGMPGFPSPARKGAPPPRRRLMSRLMGRLREASRPAGSGGRGAGQARAHPGASVPRAIAPLMVRPFRRDELAPLPEGWTVRQPDFVGVGVPKAGTTWWYRCLLDHHQVYAHRLFDRQRLATTKELSYFHHFSWSGMTQEEVDLYREAFAAPPTGITGEWATRYMFDPLAIEHLARAAPATKVLVLLRNPIDRFVSHLNHLMKNRASALQLTGDAKQLFHTFSAVPEATQMSMYSPGLQALMEHFDRDQILVQQYERCVAEPERELERLFAFLGVDAAFVPAGIDRRINRQAYVIKRPDTEGRERLAGMFRRDVAELKTLCPDVDVGLWGDFEGE